MKSIDYYSKNLNVIQQIPEDRIHYPENMPVSIYLEEAENLYQLCQEDMKILTASGLEWSIVEEIPARIFMLREAQARWIKLKSYDIQTECFPDEKSLNIREFRKWLLSSLMFSLSKNSAESSRIKLTDMNDSITAIIHILKETFSSESSIPQSSVIEPIDVAPIDRILGLSSNTASLISAISSGMALCTDHFRIRNQAYTYLKEAVDEIRNHACFIFRFEPSRIKGYKSEYRMMKLH